VSLYLYFAALITFTCLPLLKIALSKNLKNIYGFLFQIKEWLEMFVFIQGVVVGVLLTVGSILFALFHAKRTLEPNPKQPTEHKMTRSLFDIDPQSRDGWLNHLIHFLYREFQHSDSFHNFALKKMKEELNDIRNGTAKNILHTLDLNCYNFGTEFPVLGKFKLTEPEGFDPDDLPNSIGIDFDLNYDASNSNQQPFEVSGPFLIL